MTREIARLWLLFSATFILCGCTQIRADSNTICNELIQLNLREFAETSPQRQVTLEWVSNEYQTDDINYFNSGTDSSYGNITWASRSKTYSFIYSDEDMRFISIRWKEQNPSLEQVLNCLGEPELYRVIFFQAIGGYQLDLEIWYPKSGTALTFSRTYLSEQSVQISNTLGLMSVYYMDTENIQDGFNILHSDQTAERRMMWLLQLHSWPENLQEIPVELSKW